MSPAMIYYVFVLVVALLVFFATSGISVLAWLAWMAAGGLGTFLITVGTAIATDNLFVVLAVPVVMTLVMFIMGIIIFGWPFVVGSFFACLSASVLTGIAYMVNYFLSKEDPEAVYA